MDNNYHCRKIVFAMKENRTVVGIGEVLWDILPDGKKIGGRSGQFRISRITIRAAEPCSQCDRR